MRTAIFIFCAVVFLALTIVGSAKGIFVLDVVGLLFLIVGIIVMPKKKRVK
jgi:hypothetical protein